MKVLGTILRFLFSWLDSVVANLITTVYDLLLNLSNLILYSDNIVKTLGKRIGLILGIFMLFRIAITLVNYLISPDQVKDSSKGFKKLFANIFISLALLATVNHIFDFAYKLQLEVVNSNIIGKIFFGAGNSTSLKADGTEVIGPDADIGYYLYSGFFTPNTDEAGLKYCESMWDVESKVDDRCLDALDGFLGKSAYNNIWKARQNRDLSIVFSDYDIVLAKGADGFVFNYLPIISAAAGVVAVLIMISFCMDLATRAVKLLFLQIIAPIPIIANMDPSKGKDMFSKWYKECFKTYLSVFLRLIAINFAVFMITLIYGNFKGMFSGNALISVFIIIGCLMFAKQAPKLLEDMFGIKSDGMVLNPLKKFEEQALFGKNITGLAAGATMGTIGTFTHAGRGRFLTGAFGGLFGGKGLTETWKNQASVNRNMRGYLADGSTFLGRRAAQLSNILGTPSPSDNIEAQVHQIDEDIKKIDNEMKPLNDSISDRNAFVDKTKQMEDRARNKIKDGEAGFISKQYLSMVNYTEHLREQLRNGVQGVTEQDVAMAEMRTNKYLNEVGTYEYIDYTTGLINELSDYNSDGTATGLHTRHADFQKQGLDFSDGGMISMNDDLVSMTRNSTTYEYKDANGKIQHVTLDSTAVSGGASNRHSISNNVSGSVNADNRTKVAKYNNDKQQLEQRKAQLYQRQRVEKANQSAVGENK